MKLREPTAGDAERIHELARSAMTASYSLSPQQIENVITEQFAETRVTDLVDAPDDRVFALEDEEFDTLVGLTEGHLDGSSAEIRWLLVDPEHRGKGVGTELFETIVEKLREDGAERIDANVLDADREGAQFFEERGFERTDDRQVEYGGEPLVEHWYTLDASEREMSDDTGGDIDPSEMTLENTERHDGTTTATTEDGETVYLNLEETKSGTEHPFFVTYSDEAEENRYGYYCSNCGSLKTTRDAQDHIECTECGNVHTPKSAESYDDSYL